MFNEYPKALYLAGSVDGECVIAYCAEDEAGHRDKGYRMLNEPQQENEPQKRTRKAKQ